MKTLLRKTVITSLLATGLLFLNACSKNISFSPSSVVPAAEGSIKVKKDKNDNYKISLDVKNLAKPDRLQPSRTTYVVWAVSSDNRPDNIGQLKASGGDTTIDGELETMTPFKPERFFITAEDQGNAQYPNAQVVLKHRRQFVGKPLISSL